MIVLLSAIKEIVYPRFMLYVKLSLSGSIIRGITMNDEFPAIIVIDCDKRTLKTGGPIFIRHAKLGAKLDDMLGNMTLIFRLTNEVTAPSKRVMLIT